MDNQFRIDYYYSNSVWELETHYWFILAQELYMYVLITEIAILLFSICRIYVNSLICTNLLIISFCNNTIKNSMYFLMNEKNVKMYILVALVWRKQIYFVPYIGLVWYDKGNIGSLMIMLYLTFYLNLTRLYVSKKKWWSSCIKHCGCWC